MRLLDVRSVAEDRIPVFHDLHEKGPSSPLRYAILSHTWGKRQDNQDILFDDIPSSETFARFLDGASQLKQWQRAIDKKKAGFSKIVNACWIARGMNLDYIWIDSCCIDKSKSAELNESINSMYRWYQNSAQCIVYLEDLEHDGDLRNCRWIKRGWTLQELVAPSKVIFYNKRWALFGEKSDTWLCESLSKITGINMDCLQNRVHLGTLSTAHKMAWASGRETAVPEDRAYSLMGIFDVNMPLIYGEGGGKAFRRLQEEIARVSSDLSIFAWDPCFQANTGLDAFASRPDEFAAYEDIVPTYQSQHFTTTNKGILMNTILWQVLCADGKERLMLAIGKQKNGKPDIGIILRKAGNNMYMRSGNMRPFLDSEITCSTRKSTFYLVSTHVSTGYDHVLNTSRESAISIPADGLGNFHIESPVPEYAWDCEERLFFNNRHWGGSDWRAIQLVDARPAPECERRFIALFGLNDAIPDCYLLRWKEDLAFIFDRKHQTRTTRLEEFCFAVEGATNEVRMESSGAKLSIQLIPTTNENSEVRFRLQLHEVSPCEPRSTDSVKSTTKFSQLLTPLFTTKSMVRSQPSHGTNTGIDQETNGLLELSASAVSVNTRSFGRRCFSRPPVPSRTPFSPQVHGQHAILTTCETFCDSRLPNPQPSEAPTRNILERGNSEKFQVRKKTRKRVFSQSQGTGRPLPPSKMDSEQLHDFIPTVVPPVSWAAVNESSLPMENRPLRSAVDEVQPVRSRWRRRVKVGKMSITGFHTD